MGVEGRLHISFFRPSARDTECDRIPVLWKKDTALTT